jgi:hypothetical protein
LLGKCGQGGSAGRPVIFFELASEPVPKLLSEGYNVLRGARRTWRSYLDGNLGTEHENAIAMPERTNEIIPVSLFHSSSAADLA